MSDNNDGIDIPLDYNNWLSRLISPIAKRFNDRKSEVDVEMKVGFYKYCMRVQERCGHIKTILSKGELLDIKDFYVSPDLKLGKTIYNQEGLIKRLDNKKRLILTGTAGLGKSIFLKHLAVSYSHSYKRPLPIFFELRELNDTAASIEDTLFKTLNTPKEFMTKSQFEYALQEGVVALLLDAFDEIDFDIREKYEKEIISLSARYPDLQIIVTSRPSANESVEGWGPFEHIKLLPFDLTKVVELISKSKEDASEKEKFIDLVKNRLFQSHESFLSTPLLALIMFITYQAGGQIPDKLHEFYHRAFEALYYRHDNDKGHYNRKKYASLNRDEFLRMISAVCAITYFEGLTVLPDFEFRKKIDAAKSIECIETDTNKFLDDMIESVCLLQRDGTDVIFTHRSFQEYFTATFILNSEVLDTFGIINRLISRQGFDNVVFMIGEMNREFIEKKWVLRWLNLFVDKMKDVDCIANPMSYCRYMRYQGMIYRAEDGYKFGFTGNSEDASAIGAIFSGLYRRKWEDHYRPANFTRANWDKECTKIVKYYAQRDNLKLRSGKKPGDSTYFDVKILEKDNEIFARTQFAQSFEAQKKFLMDLKVEIEQRHKDKGEGFMSLIRR